MTREEYTMRIGLLVPVLVFGIGAAAVGCGDDSGLPPSQNNDMSAGAQDMAVELDMSIPDDAKRIVTFTMFAEDYAQTVCAHYMMCGQLDAAQMAACIERTLRHTGWDQDAEIMKGRLEINELQCLDAISMARCDNSDHVQWGSRCADFLYIAHQPNGAVCLAAAECKSGYCQHGGSDAGIPEQYTGCPGICADPKPIGAVCRLQTDCATDAVCKPVAAGQPPQCVKRAAVGEACTGATGEPCQTTLMCPTFPATQPATCVTATTQTALHGACDPAQGAVTAMPPCSAPMYCRVKYTASTTACNATTNCGAGYCDLGSATCQLPSGGTCETKLAAGAACDPHNEGPFSFIDSQCADGTICYQAGTQTTPTCQAYGGNGAACLSRTATTGTCKVGFNCVGGVCTPWVSDTQACGANLQCPSFGNVCIVDNADAGSNKTCQVTKNFGATCDPTYESSLCAASDNVGSSTCVATGSSGVCAPKCY